MIQWLGGETAEVARAGLLTLGGLWTFMAGIGTLGVFLLSRIFSGNNVNGRDSPTISTWTPLPGTWLLWLVMGLALWSLWSSRQD